MHIAVAGRDLNAGTGGERSEGTGASPIRLWRCTSNLTTIVPSVVTNVQATDFETTSALSMTIPVCAMYTQHKLLTGYQLCQA